MTRLLALPALCFAAPASAHVGHLGEFAGHDHWVAGAALGAALAATLWGVLKGKKEESAEPEDEAEPEEETA